METSDFEDPSCQSNVVRHLSKPHDLSASAISEHATMALHGLADTNTYPGESRSEQDQCHGRPDELTPFRSIELSLFPSLSEANLWGSCPGQAGIPIQVGDLSGFRSRDQRGLQSLGPLGAKMACILGRSVQTLPLSIPFWCKERSQLRTPNVTIS